jgi:S1-C subfamily serine protease
VVSRVLADGPAAKAGLKKGDQILSVQTKDIADVAAVLQQASKVTAGKTLSLSIERNQEKHELKITAGDGL